MGNFEIPIKRASCYKVINVHCTHFHGEKIIWKFAGCIFGY